MADQEGTSLERIPPPADPNLSRLENAASTLLNFLSGPFLLCEPSISKGLQALCSLAFAALKPRKEVLSIAPSFEVLVEPEASGSNSTTSWGEVQDMLSNGKACFDLFENTRNIAHLEDALQLSQLALDLCSAGHPQRDAAVNNLATCLLQRYKDTGDMVDLTESICLWTEWLANNPPGHPVRGNVLNNLAHSLQLHYNQAGNLADLQDAVVLNQECLELRPEGHPRRQSSLNNLASLFDSHYNLRGNLEDLEDIITLQRESLECCELGDPTRHTNLNNLAGYLSKRYDRIGTPEDLKEAIVLGQESLDLCPPGHPARDTSLNNLSRYLGRHFDRGGNLEDLEGAISLQRESVELCPPGHRGRDSFLNNLAGYLGNRYRRTGNVADLEETITLERESLKLCPPGHPTRGNQLNNLSVDFWQLYTRVGSLEDLEDAIRLQRESLELCPPGHPGRDSSLHNLAGYLSARHNQTGRRADLEEAISLQRESLKLRPQGHPLRDSTLSNLSGYLAKHCDITNNEEDLVEAINLQREGLELCPPGHPDRAVVLIHLAGHLIAKRVRSQTHLQNWDAFETGFSEAPLQQLTRVSDFFRDSEAVTHEVPKLLQEAAQHAMSSTNDRMAAAVLWRVDSRKSGSPSELEVVRTILNLMDLAVAESATLEDLSNQLSDRDEFKEAQGIASDAAALTIESGDLRLAVSLLEQGRSIIYSQLGRYRSAIDDVRKVSPELAERLVDLSVELDALVVRGERVESKSNFRTKPFDDNTSRHFNARMAWNQTIEEIRQLPGLESFLLPSPFERLQEAASEGPVIIVNINQRRSDAIIVHSEGDPDVVSLPEASPQAVQNIIDGFGERPAECTTRKAIGLLREIWVIIVEPIATQLLLTQDGRSHKSRIWWCPTGVASKLPLHAAGPYKSGEKNLSHLFIPSYTPTLGTLIRARQERGDNLTAKESPRSILIVGQPETPGELRLPEVGNEVEAVQKQAPHASILLSSDGTKDAVLTGLCQHAWLHLACHGHYDTKKPFHSSFSMHDGRITFLDLIGWDLPHAELAFLSACHSARPSETLPDEALHPAAGMLFAGFKSVIGTMWAFDDGVGSALAGRFYELMMEGKKGYTDAAVVLADAIQDISKGKGSVPFMQKINVVHYGV